MERNENEKGNGKIRERNWKGRGNERERKGSGTGKGPIEGKGGKGNILGLGCKDLRFRVKGFRVYRSVFGSGVTA